MDGHRVRRLAEVLVASQLRNGRATSDPKSFFGRGISILVLDVAAFLLAYFGATGFLSLASQVEPSIAGSSAAVLLPILPAVAMGIILVGGVMFELTASARFAGSDAVNWLPLVSSEYVMASTLAIAYSYSLPLALGFGAGLAIAVATGQYLTFGVAAALALLAVIEAGFLIEVVRSITQRMGSVVVGRAGRVTIVARAAIIVVVLLVLQFSFNPALLYDLLGPSGPGVAIATYVPFLWTSRIVYATHAGAYAVGGLFAVGVAGLFAGCALLAFRLRERYWVPAPIEIKLAAHAYGETHPWLARLGFGPVEASIVTKDLHGLFRRKEMVPLLALPVVLGISGLVSLGASGSGSGPGTILWASIVAGFFALFLATTSIGQERRGLVNLYANPVPSRSVFRAKAGLVVLLAGSFGLAVSIALGLLYKLPFWSAAGTWAISLMATLEGTFVGLTFAVRYSDFQERPRPQYLRPAAMIGAMGVGMLVLLLTAGPLAFGIAAPQLGSAVLIPLLLFGAAVALLVIPITFYSARTGMDRMMRELPF